MESSFIKDVIKKAQEHHRHIVLPEGGDKRVLEAANIINRDKIARITVLGNKDEIHKYFKEQGYDINGIDVIDPENTPFHDEFAEKLYELRKHRSINRKKARELVKKFNYFGTMMVHGGRADGLVSGAVQSTADTVRPALQIIRAKDEGVDVSSFFVMCVNDIPYLFADCGLVQEPDKEELADIAVQSALSALKLNIPARVAMLSYSTYGSAFSRSVDKVLRATKIALNKLNEHYGDLPITLDGELQLDAAIVPSVAAKKCPDSKMAGSARVLIFPDLDAGNIGYKLVQRMAGAEAYGPILQGLNKPVNDLSRGCGVEDIVGAVAITALQSINQGDK
ncbi:MAG: phosphate acetyltransferase [Alphaproteobacteria bacterium]|nr:phosphate acetyltransferase [Alphaproteobacteria bacterium]